MARVSSQLKFNGLLETASGEGLSMNAHNETRIPILKWGSYRIVL